MIVKFRLRRDTAANWTANNPTLALGEPGLETDTRKVKYGDGATAWTSLAYSAAGAVAWADITSKPANLTAIAGLTTAADQITYWTGSGTAAQATLSAFGRSLIDDADAAAGRTTLGLGTAATQNTGTSGAAVPLLNGSSLIWSNGPTFGTGGTGSGTVSVALNGGSGTGGGPYFRFQKNGTTTGYFGAVSAISGGASNDIVVHATQSLVLHAGSGLFIKSDNSLVPSTDDALYLGKNDDDTPAAWKGLILKDQSNGKYYRIEMIAGVLTATDLTD